ncbi:MAG: glycosyltransferase family 39 protein [Gaiellaceae bacterium]
MTTILLLQLVFLALGAGALPVLGIVTTRAELRARLPLAYLVGVAIAGIVAAHLALVNAAVGVTELVVLAIVVWLFARRRLRDPGERKPTRLGVVGPIAFLLALLLLAHVAHMLETRPLYEWDGWAIWATKARALFDFGGAYTPVFTTYPPVQHPLFLPALEAIDFHALGRFDGTLLHVQLGLLAFGFAAALWTLLRERVSPALAGLGVLAIVSATAFVKQLSTNYADVPLALFVALGAVCLARWLAEGDAKLARAAALFLGAATLVKPEGLLFVAAAVVAALLAGGRERVRGTVLIGVAAALVLAPWRLYVALHHLTNPEYSLGNAVDPVYLWDHADRLGPALRSIAGHAFSLDWGLLAPLAVVAIAAALLSGRTRLGAFALLWTLLSFAGVVLVFWISVVPVELTLRWAAYRTVASLVIGAAALAPLLVAETRLSAFAGTHAKYLLRKASAGDS